MGIFRRISDIIASNVNDLIDKAEDPEKMAKQIIREMEQGIGEVRGQVAMAMASDKQLANQLENARREVGDWQQRAVRAIELGKDDLARQALLRKRDAERSVHSLEPQVARAAQSFSMLREQLKVLEDRIMLARRKRDTIIARQRMAEAQVKVHRSLDSFGKGSTHLSRMSGITDRVEELEARVSAEMVMMADSVTLEEQFQKIDEDRDIDAELAALKEQVKKSPPGGPGGLAQGGGQKPA